MNSFIKVGLIVVASIFVSGCAQKVRIKALNPAEVGALASKKKIAVSEFKNDHIGLSGKIEAEVAKQKLDKKHYFTVLSRKNMDKIMAEQKLQSSEMMDEKTATKVGKVIGAQAIISGEVTSNAVSGSYKVDKEKCLKYTKTKDGLECSKYRYYKVTCRTTKASVSANINIIDVENTTIIYGDTVVKDYSADSCHSHGNILSRYQALNKLAAKIADEFVYKLTPNYTYFDVTLLNSIELERVTAVQNKKFEAALAYIKVARYEKAKKLLGSLMDEFDGKSYVVAYVYGVVYEATGDFDKAKEMYTIADDDTIEPVEEINLAINRIDSLIANRDEARKQINAR